MSINSKLILENSKDMSLLYVEDDVSLREATSNIFNNYFKEVCVAVDGRDGLKKYLDHKKDNGEYFDLVITDINMPNMDGVDMSKVIINENHEQPLIFITAFNETAYLQNAIEVGADGFLTKPIDMEQLNKLLYKTTQAIADRKDVLKYYKQIEDLNIQLQNQYEELKSNRKEIEKSSRVLDTIVNKSQILNRKKDANKKSDSNEEAEKENIIKQLEQFVSEDLHELAELVEELDITVISIVEGKEVVTKEIVDDLVNNFTRYSSVISFYSFSHDLHKALNEFINVIKNNPIPEDAQHVVNIFTILESFMFVLQKWHKDLRSNDLGTVNFLDASIISDLNTIANMWVNEFDEVADDDLDDMFF